MKKNRSSVRKSRQVAVHRKMKENPEPEEWVLDILLECIKKEEN